MILNGKNMITLIDEPELHLHSKIQEKFIKFLIDISKETQVIITTHSPILIKQLLENNYVKVLILNKDITYSRIGQTKLQYNSANEINYLAFNLVTEKYHNELYEEIRDKIGIELLPIHNIGLLIVLIITYFMVFFSSNIKLY